MKRCFKMLLLFCAITMLFVLPAIAAEIVASGESATSEITDDYYVTTTLSPNDEIEFLLGPGFDTIFSHHPNYSDVVTVSQVQKIIALLEAGREGWEMQWDEETYNSRISKMTYFDNIGSMSFEPDQYMTVDQMLAVAVRMCGGEAKVMELNKKTSPAYWATNWIAVAKEYNFHFGLGDYSDYTVPLTYSELVCVCIELYNLVESIRDNFDIIIVTGKFHDVSVSYAPKNPLTAALYIYMTQNYGEYCEIRDGNFDDKLDIPDYSMDDIIVTCMMTSDNSYILGYSFKCTYITHACSAWKIYGLQDYSRDTFIDHEKGTTLDLIYIPKIVPDCSRPRGHEGYYIDLETGNLYVYSIFNSAPPTGGGYYVDYYVDEIETVEFFVPDSFEHPEWANIIQNSIEATVYTNGYTGDTYCMKCNTLIKKGNIIPAFSHVHQPVLNKAQTASCTSAGTEAYYTCNVCDKLFSDEACTQLLEAPVQFPIDPNNHAGGIEIRDVKDAAEFEAGYTGDTYCLGCNTKIATGTVIPATHEHHFSDATCTAPQTCSCGAAIGEKNPDHHAGPTKIMYQNALYTGDEICTACGNVIHTGNYPISVFEPVVDLMEDVLDKVGFSNPKSISNQIIHVCTDLTDALVKKISKFIFS